MSAELPTVAAIDLPSEASWLEVESNRVAIGLRSGAIMSLRLHGSTDLTENASHEGARL